MDVVLATQQLLQTSVRIYSTYLDRLMAVFKKYQEKEMDFAVDCRAVRLPRALRYAHFAGLYYQWLLQSSVRTHTIYRSVQYWRLTSIVAPAGA
jgi:hypothetical protein